MIEKLEIPRPITVDDLYRMKMDILRFDGPWAASFGRPEVRGSWLIWGRSSEGKTRLALQLAKYLSSFGKVLFDSLEEGRSASIRQGFKEVQMEDVKRFVHLLDQEPIDKLASRLAMRNSARFIIIDSIQYTFMDVPQYKSLLQEFPGKLFLFTSHAKGKEPKGALAESVWFDSSVKVYVEGYRAFPKSRYGGGAPYDIWPEEAEKYWTGRIQNLEY